MLSELFPQKEKILSRARILRKTKMTNAEQLLWNEIRAHRLYGLKFRRQIPLGPYIADFLCIEKKLIIELDGKSHEERKSYDERRTKYLEEHGFQVLRFTNDDVENDVEIVLKKIAEFCTPLL